MKRIWSLLIAAVLAVSLCGCDGNTPAVSDGGEETITTTPESTTTTTEKPTTTSTGAETTTTTEVETTTTTAPATTTTTTSTTQSVVGKPTLESKPSTTTTASTTTTTATTTEKTYVTQPPKAPNAAGVVNIVNWTALRGEMQAQVVPPPFYVDKDYTYGFGVYQDVMVYYEDGTERSLEAAMERGDVTEEDLERFGIRYLKTAWEPEFYVWPEASKKFGQREKFYSDKKYDYYFERPISECVVLHLPYSSSMKVKKALEKGIITIEEFLDGEHTAKVIMVNKATGESKTVTPVVTAPYVSTYSSDLPRVAYGEIYVVLTPRASAKISTETLTPAYVSENFHVNAERVIAKSVWSERDANKKPTGREYITFKVVLKEKTKDAIRLQSLNLKENKDVWFVSTDTLEQTEEKVPSTATVDDDFEEQVVLFTFTKEASVVNMAYSAEDFSYMFGIEITSVRDLTRIDTEEGLAWINHENYRQIFKVTIPKKGKQAVLDAVKKIEQHPYVVGADPNMRFTLDW